MNCGIILLFLLFFNQHGRTSGCGCGNSNPPCRSGQNGRGREGEMRRERERDNDRDGGCPCNNDARFEPRFEPRPFSETGCGCND